MEPSKSIFTHPMAGSTLVIKLDTSLSMFESLVHKHLSLLRFSITMFGLVTSCPVKINRACCILQQIFKAATFLMKVVHALQFFFNFSTI